MTDREQEILDIIKKDPLISQNALADLLCITRSSISVHISNLIKKGYIRGKGYVISDEISEVVVIGGANIDITGTSDKCLIPEDSNPGRILLSSGGVGRNIAENLVRLGVKVKLISALGDDLYGDRILTESASIGIDLSLTAKYADQSTSVYLQVLDSDKHMKLAISDMNIMEKITVELLQKYHRHLEYAKVIVADGNLSEEAINYLAEQFGHKIFFDTVSTTKAHKIKSCYHKLLCLTPNMIEVEALIGGKISNYTEALLMLKDKGLKMPIITLGENGIVYLEDGKPMHSNPFRSDIVSVTGAGDALLSGIVYGYINKMANIDIINYGLAMAKLALESNKAVSDKISVEAVRKAIQEEREYVG